jgi:hypothetical protein
MKVKYYHCPNDCEKPQPFYDHVDGVAYCGRCYFENRGLVKCFLCTPETCPEDVKEE